MASAFDRPVFARARRLCLACPETTEATAWGHPNFRTGNKVFCSFELFDRRPSIAFRVTAAEARRLTRKPNFFQTPYGRGLWVSLRLDVPVDWTMVRDLIERSYREVATRRAVRVSRSKLR